MCEFISVHFLVEKFMTNTLIESHFSSNFIELDNVNIVVCNVSMIIIST